MSGYGPPHFLTCRYNEVPVFNGRYIHLQYADLSNWNMVIQDSSIIVA